MIVKNLIDFFVIPYFIIENTRNQIQYDLFVAFIDNLFAFNFRFGIENTRLSTRIIKFE